MTFSYDLEFEDGTTGTVVVAIDEASAGDDSEAFFEFMASALAEWFGGESETVSAIVH